MAAAAADANAKAAQQTSLAEDKDAVRGRTGRCRRATVLLTASLHAATWNARRRRQQIAQLKKDFQALGQQVVSSGACVDLLFRDH